MFTTSIIKLSETSYPQRWMADAELRENMFRYKRLSEEKNAGKPYVKEDLQLGTFFIVAEKQY